MSRLFLALALPAIVRAELTELAGRPDGVRWTPPENLHLTLRFIGEADAGKQAAFAEALASVRVEPFILPVAGVDIFPPRGPARVLWAGLGHAHPRLFQLRKQADEALLSVDPTLDVHSFRPHISLGRLGENHDPKALMKFLERHAAFEAPPFRVDEFHLMASDLSPGRAPAYRVEGSFPLQPK